jgi:hypothetical protein
MKKALFGLALAAVTFACASEPKTAVSDDAAPKAEASCESKTECSGEMKAECSTEAKTCPVTGKQIN